MTTTTPGPRPDPIAAHQALTGRLAALTAFVNHFVFARGAVVAREFNSDEPETPLAIAEARDLALVEAFAAISRIARETR